jgi:arylsulfatase
VQLIWFRSFTVEVALAHRTGDRGYLVAHGDQGSGYGVYVLDEHIWFVHNDGRGSETKFDAGVIPSGASSVVLAMDALAGRRWSSSIAVDGAPPTGSVEVAMLFGIAPFEGIDVGIDRRSPVSWEIFERFGPFPYTGTLRSARYVPGEPGPDSPDRLIDIIRSMGAKFE